MTLPVTRRILLVLLVLALLAGCTPGGGEATDPSDEAAGSQPDDDDVAAEPAETEPPPLQPAVRPPDEPTVVVDADDPAARSLETAELLFEEAPVVVLADADDPDAHVTAASAAVALGAPALLTSAALEASGALVEGLEGLGTELVVVIGDTAPEPAGDAWELLRLDASAAAVAEALGRDAGDVAAVTPEEALAALADGGQDGPLLDLEAAPADPDDEGSEQGAEPGATEAQPAEPTAEPTRGDASATSPPDAPTAESTEALERHERAAPVEDLDALVVAGDSDALAPLASAMAAGAQPLVLDDADPRATSESVQAIAERTPSQVLGIGDLGDPEQLRDRLDVAATGVELPGGGQVLFPDRRFVALYGHPHSTALGALGEQGLEATLQRAEEVAAPYAELDDTTVIPTFEIITTIASAGPAPSGDYSIRTDLDVIRPYIDAAAENGYYVVLDLQPGRTDFLTQAQEYEELLREPHVGLALDPEWRLGPDQLHMRQIGGVEADEVNSVVEWLADLTREHALPQKLLVLHQFKFIMLPDRERIDFSRDELAVLIHMDGNGTPGMKRDTWNALTEDAPEGAWWGWKNFYDEDSPTMTPEQTLEMEPDPLFISYQ